MPIMTVSSPIRVVFIRIGNGGEYVRTDAENDVILPVLSTIKHQCANDSYVNSDTVLDVFVALGYRWEYIDIESVIPTFEELVN